MSLTLIEAPEIEPVGLTDVKSQCRIDLQESEEDYILEMYISAARQQVEEIGCNGIQIVAATYELRLDRFPYCGDIELPKPPLLSMLSVKYIDTDGVLQTIYDSTVSPVIDEGIFSPPDVGLYLPSQSSLRLAYGQNWPSARCEPNAVRIQFRSGFGEASVSPLTVPDFPAGIRTGICVLAANLYEHREETVVGHIVQNINIVEYFLRPYRLGPHVA